MRYAKGVQAEEGERLEVSKRRLKRVASSVAWNEMEDSLSSEPAVRRCECVADDERCQHDLCRISKDLLSQVSFQSGRLPPSDGGVRALVERERRPEEQSREQKGTPGMTDGDVLA